MTEYAKSILYTEKDVVAHIESTFRLALRNALSHAWEMTVDMDHARRARFLNALEDNFSPDNKMADAFSDAFHAVNVELDTDIADLE